MMPNGSIVRNAETPRSDLMLESLAIKRLFLKELHDMRELVRVVIGTILGVLTENQVYNSRFFKIKVGKPNFWPVEKSFCV